MKKTRHLVASMLMLSSYTFAANQPSPEDFLGVCKYVLNDKQVAIKKIASSAWVGEKIAGVLIKRIEQIVLNQAFRYRWRDANSIIQSTNDLSGQLRDTTTTVPYYSESIHSAVEYQPSVDKMMYRKIVFKWNKLYPDSLGLNFIVEKFGYVYNCEYKTIINPSN